MEIYFVRHAQPEWSRDGMGVDDPGLTPLGWEQAERWAERLCGWSFDDVWVSTARRAKETAAPLLARTGATPKRFEWLVELGLPDLSRMTAAEVDAFFHGTRHRPVHAWWEGLPGAESAGDFTRRVCEGLDQELRALGGRCTWEGDHGFWHDFPPGHRVLVVCHAGTTGVALSHLLGLPQVPWAWERFYLRHTGMAKVKTTPIAHGHLFGMRVFNDTEHLPSDALRTR